MIFSWIEKGYDRKCFYIGVENRDGCKESNLILLTESILFSGKDLGAKDVYGAKNPVTNLELFPMADSR